MRAMFALLPLHAPVLIVNKCAQCEQLFTVTGVSRLIIVDAGIILGLEVIIVSGFGGD